MSKVIIFSLTFQKSHPRAGEPTYFVEKLITALCEENASEDLKWKLIQNLIFNYDVDFAILDSCSPKYHTIRSGNRFKVGEFFSPRAWFGKPYKSYQYKLADDIQIEKIWNIEIMNHKIFIDGSFYAEYKYPEFIFSNFEFLATNDGLSPEDFINWFPADKVFKGQIICWNSIINY
jgi:hypothetical protein